VLFDERVKVETEAADESVASRIHDHVVGMEFCERLQIGMQHDASIRFTPQ
jgi:archaellum component FlaD/FlaE